MVLAVNPLIWPHRTIVLLILSFAVLALSGALVSQYMFGLHPCILCLYQRVPYGIVILLSALALCRASLARIVIGLCGVVFLVGAAIAFFHVGVEQQWWRGFEGCSTPAFTGSVEDMMRAIESAPRVACDQVAWTFLGLSMAGYNVAASGLAGLACLLWVFKTPRPSSRR